ncbi:hypothetical protein EON62_06065, partial [archaeon]
LQTIPAIVEASELMVVPRLIVTAQSNRPVMGIVQDTLLGSRLMTRRDVFIPRDVVMNMVMWMTPWDGHLPLPAILKPVRGKPGRHVPLWTGKQMFSMFMPDLNYNKKANEAEDSLQNIDHLWADDCTAFIRGGELHMGLLDKASLGNKSGSILHIIMNDVSPEDTRDFINNTQRVVNYWLLHHGFSIGVSDTEAPVSTQEEIGRSIEKARRDVEHVAQRMRRKGELERQPGQTLLESFESVVNKVLTDTRNDAAKAAQRVLSEDRNSLVAMLCAGSKGSTINIAQIIACVGQQSVEGKRIPYGWKYRTLPHFSKFDTSASARGFVENSYLRGLLPSEFFFHMMGGREGLIDTGTF